QFYKAPVHIHIWILKIGNRRLNHAFAFSHVHNKETQVTVCKVDAT
ncbi:hypothetical protein FOXB_03329, partial [Fusarium oxysporum f. sp. conglutinans Fo5176]